MLGKTPPKSLGLKRALELLRQPDHRLMVMHTPASPNGNAYYVVPGGYLDREDAEAIIGRPDVSPLDGGLFPGCHQSWRLG